jgi:oxaloacetate decarboxylase alpha subunit
MKGKPYRGSANKSVKITDTTLRDAHQSLWATRMRLEDILPIAEKIDNVGYHSVEVWGGATFDVCLRFLNEDPWVRLKAIKECFSKTPLQMLLRGQNVVGYNNYPDDVLKAFVYKAAENGIDIFRIFDALNDVRNLEKAIKFVKDTGKHAQGNVCYTISPVHNIDAYIKCAKEQVELGIDSLNIKDMSGILTPYIAYELVSRLKDAVDIPIQLHCHSSSGMASVTYLKAIEAGIDVIDCAVAPLALYTSQPPVESIVAILRDTKHTSGLNLKQVNEVSEYFESVAVHRHLKRARQSMIDINVIIHQIPGGMMSNLIVQLEKQKSLHRMEEVLNEIPKVRKELGYPPLVTPTSQIVGTQAVLNVILGERYKLVPNEVKNYVKGFYGRAPEKISDKMTKKILGNEKPITCRPADLIEPIMGRVKKDLSKEFVEKEEDYISYALFPKAALSFFKRRKDPVKYADELTEEEKMLPKDKDIEIEEVLDDVAQFVMQNKVSEAEVINKKFKIKLKSNIRNLVRLSGEPEEAKEEETVSKKKKVIEHDKGHTKVLSPMIGAFYRAPYPGADPFTEEGKKVKKGDTLCIVEAMKLMNEIKSPISGVVKTILVENGEPLEKDQVMFYLEKK